MSWSVSGIGKAPAVAASIEKQFAAMDAYPCPEPEETAKQACRKIIAALCAGQTRSDCMAVKISASGSQSWSGSHPGPITDVSNTLNLSFESLYGFAE